MSTQRTNWAGNYTYQAARLHTPDTVEAVQTLVARSRHIKALGTRHAFNGIADTRHDHLSLERLNRIVALDREARTVTVEAGVRYGDLCAYLNREGFALQNMASLPHISVAGACATATHGSGDRCGNLATAVSALEMVIADGRIIRLTRQHSDFRGAVVGLGALGVVTSLTLDLVPRYDMRQDVYLRLPMTRLEASFDDITSAAYSVCLFTTWQHPWFEQAWLKSRLADNEPFWGADRFYEAERAAAPVAPIAETSAERCTEQMGIPGDWNDRLPHFRMAFTPSYGEELQSEYLVPREHALTALGRIHALRAPCPAPADFRGSHGGRRRPVAQPVLRGAVCGNSLHLEARLGGSAPAAAADRTGAAAAGRAPALGQAVHPAGGGAGPALQAAARLPAACPPVRPQRQVPQHLPQPHRVCRGVRQKGTFVAF